MMENAVEFYDFDHSHEEERFLLLGLSTKLRVLLICHCYRKEDEIIRIISARRATKNEEKNIEMDEMKTEYDLSRMKRRKSPYSKMLKQQVTIRLDSDTIQYFKELAVQTGLPYQNLINLYLRDCAQEQRKLEMRWT